jgi:GxxExxY protein
LIIGAAIEVHRVTGPGLMESVYEECLCYELSQRGLRFQRQLELPIRYKGINLDCGFRMDLVVEDAVVLELKTVDTLLPLHSAQLLTYLKLSGKKLGLLINFNEPTLKKGLKRLVNHFPDPETKPITSAPSAPQLGERKQSRRIDNISKSQRLSVSAVNTPLRFERLKRLVNHFPDPETKPITSAPSAPQLGERKQSRRIDNISKSQRLSVSAVNPPLRFERLTRLVSHFLEPETKPITSAPSAPQLGDRKQSRPFENILKTLRLSVSAVNALSVNHPVNI